jgi:class 3 adenylate cyclase
MSPRNLILLAVGLIVLTAAYGLYLGEEWRGGPWRTHVMIEGAAGPMEHPRVLRLVPGRDPETSVLRPGDRLVRAGERELAGARAWTVYAALYAAADADGFVLLEAQRGERRMSAQEQLVALPHAWRDAALGICFVITALLILRRAPGSPWGKAFAAASLVWAIAQAQFQGPAPAQTYAYFVVRGTAGLLWAPRFVLAAIRFPEGVWPDERPLPRWPWCFGVLGLTWTSLFVGGPFPLEFALRANPTVGTAAIAAVLIVVTRNFMLAGPEGQRQVKWVLLGIFIGFAPGLVGTAVGAIRPDLTTIWFASQAAAIALPISIFIAITRSNFLDIDRLISRTASYTILLVGLGAGALTAVPRLAELASTHAGVDEAIVQLALGVVVAFCVVRLEPIVRPQVERVFFAERQAFQDGIDQLVADIQTAPDAATVAEQLDALLRPEFLIVYARGESAFAPVFSRRTAITPHFDPRGPFVAALAERVSAIGLERERGFFDRGDAAERAALRGLDAAVLVPVVRDRSLLGLLALGHKGSADVYTPTDLALLGMVGNSVAASVMRFDDEELLQQARRAQERLRQYVPASIAQHLEAGRDLEAGERQVSILFADLRGYTSLSEGRHAEEIFALVGRYTETVTRVVSELGGTVVEFNGDGMMAVFGAPDPVPDKERRALAAARRIVADVSALGSFGPGGRLVVGVGLATGSAYVGAIPSVDRYIWSAIGNTTNLAARLQALTRDFQVPIVIDEETHDAAREEALDFERRPATPIRGLRSPRDVFVLSRSRVAA